MVQADNEEEMVNSEDDDDAKVTPVSIKKAINGLKTFISFFEQQKDDDYDVNDLRIFRKYLRVVRVQEISLKKQGTIDLFFNDCGI